MSRFEVQVLRSIVRFLLAGRPPLALAEEHGSARPKLVRYRGSSSSPKVPERPLRRYGMACPLAQRRCLATMPRIPPGPLTPVSSATGIRMCARSAVALERSPAGSCFTVAAYVLRREASAQQRATDRCDRVA